MDAKKFFEEARRMCGKQERCRECPALGKDAICLLLSPHNRPNAAKNIDKAIEAVEKWSQENPKKTRLDDFKEKHPNARVNKKGLPFVLPRFLGYCQADSCEDCLRLHGGWILKDCWDQEVESDGE